MARPSARGREYDASIPADIEPPTAELLGPVHQGHVRQANAWSVLSSVRSAGVTSRSRVARETGLTGMTVHRLMIDLRHRKLVVGGGRPKRGSV